MIDKKCLYCRKNYKSSMVHDKCIVCDEQLKNIVANITKNYNKGLENQWFNKRRIP